MTIALRMSNPEVKDLLSKRWLPQRFRHKHTDNDSTWTDSKSAHGTQPLIHADSSATGSGPSQVRPPAASQAQDPSLRTPSLGLSGLSTPPTFAYISLLSQEVKAKLFHRHFFHDTESHCYGRKSIGNIEFRNESVADSMRSVRCQLAMKGG